MYMYFINNDKIIKTLEHILNTLLDAIENKGHIEVEILDPRWSEVIFSFKRKLQGKSFISTYFPSLYNINCYFGFTKEKKRNN